MRQATRKHNYSFHNCHSHSCFIVSFLHSLYLVQSHSHWKDHSRMSPHKYRDFKWRPVEIGFLLSFSLIDLEHQAIAATTTTTTAKNWMKITTTKKRFKRNTKQDSRWRNADSQVNSFAVLTVLTYNLLTPIMAVISCAPFVQIFWLSISFACPLKCIGANERFIAACKKTAL